MTESSLDRPGVVTLVGERVAAGVPEHVRMGLQFEASADRGGLDHPGKARGRERRTTLADEDEGRRRTFTLQAPQRPQLVAKEAASPWIDRKSVV